MSQQQKPTVVFSRVLQELKGQQRGQASSQRQDLGTHQVSTTTIQAAPAQVCGADTCLCDPSLNGLHGNTLPNVCACACSTLGY